jgi:hypothetical protein
VVRLWLFGAAVLGACAPARHPSVVPSSGRYAATIESRGAGCCSESCGAHSTIAEVSLELEAGGRARAQWSRTGCTVLESGGDGPREMAYDPGTPAALCALRAVERGVRRDVNPLDARRAWAGSWERAGDGIVVALRDRAATWRLECSGQTRPGLLACRSVDAAWELSAGLEIGGVLYLDDAPGLRVIEVQRGRDGDVRFEYSERGTVRR